MFLERSRVDTTHGQAYGAAGAAMGRRARPLAGSHQDRLAGQTAPPTG